MAAAVAVEAAVSTLAVEAVRPSLAMTVPPALSLIVSGLLLPECSSSLPPVTFEAFATSVLLLMVSTVFSNVVSVWSMPIV